MTIPTGAFDKKDLLGGVVLDSYKKCGDFVNSIVQSETNINTAGDISATVLSGLATAFSPLATVHALTAASTIVTGTKTAINSDVWAKASASDLVQAIDGTYYKDMASYTATLTTMDVGEVEVQNEIAKITSIHQECALGPAEVTITKTLSPPTTTPPVPNTGGSPTAGSPTGGSPTGPGANGAPAPAPALEPAEPLGTGGELNQPAITQSGFPGSRLY